MTRETLLKAFEMRIDGATYEEIGEELHYSKYNVAANMRKVMHGCKRRSEIHSEFYPKLAALIAERYRDQHTFAKRCGVADSVISNLLHHGKLPKKRKP